MPSCSKITHDYESSSNPINVSSLVAGRLPKAVKSDTCAKERINKIFVNGTNEFKQLILNQYEARNNKDSRGHRWVKKFLSLCLRM